MMAVLFLLFLSGCSQEAKKKDLKDLTDNYTLEQAKEDGCLVLEDGDVTSGQEMFESFLLATTNREHAFIRVANYYTLGDKFHYSAEYYVEIKDNYPLMYIKDITFEDGLYTTSSYASNDDQLYMETYKYMIKENYLPKSSFATFSSSLIYFLADDENMTWQDVEDELLSSQYVSERISAELVYQTRTYK